MKNLQINKIYVVCLFLIAMSLLPPMNVYATPNNNMSVSEAFEQDHETDDLFNDNAPFNDQSDDQPVEQEEDEAIAFQNDRSLFLDFVKMIFALVLVLGLIYFLLKFLQKRTRIYQQTRSLENLGGISLGTNKSVQIIRVGNKYYLVGVGEDVNLLTAIDDPDTLSEIINEDSTTGETQPFKNILKNFQNMNKNPYRQEETKQNIETELKTMKNARERIMKRYQNGNEGRDE